MSCSTLCLDDIIALYEDADHKYRKSVHPNTRSYSASADDGHTDYVTIYLYTSTECDYVINTARWAASSSVLAQGIAEHICKQVEGLTLTTALNREFTELGQWRHRSCSILPVKALRDAATKAKENTRT